ncbi:MAG TPA: hypothetical protein VNQ80_00225 [Parapedobacter sp.]|uniref:hypothetical protein n=1 Tax=Parapedobacter sp. TaxID=1958893 RepID=UPI002C385CA3|nr:hypothetical protein [Parapedobacter sp.]HWK55725.1 hypothetical protein [Parapedobacter sp.]
MNTHLIIWPVLLALSLMQGMAQNVKYQTDKHIVHQQERMVFKQWNRDKFTPKKGFLGLNYQYWLTWAWHPNYPRTDRRPLSFTGPQTLRLQLVAAMKNTEEAYKKHADTLRNTALTEMVNYAGAASAADPLWQLYYRGEFRPLTDGTDPLEGAELNVRDYLTYTGLLEWYREEREALAERLDAARATNMDRGSRIMAYHRMLGEYRQLSAMWEAKKQRTKLYLSLTETDARITEPGQPMTVPPGRTDQQIADDILSKSKL